MSPCQHFSRRLSTCCGLVSHDKDVIRPVSHVLLSRCRGFLALLLLTAATIFSGAGASTAHWDYTGLHFTEDQIQPKHLILTVFKAHWCWNMISQTTNPSNWTPHKTSKLVKKLFKKSIISMVSMISQSALHSLPPLYSLLTWQQTWEIQDRGES